MLRPDWVTSRSSVASNASNKFTAILPKLPGNKGVGMCEKMLSAMSIAVDARTESGSVRSSVMTAARAGRALLRIAFCAAGELDEEREPKTSEMAEPRSGSVDQAISVSKKQG